MGVSKGPHGWIILNKPPGLGSTQAVSAVKRNLRDAGLLGKLRDGPKVGHGGTLDPLAEGVLPIALGEATKLTGRLLEADKIYDFTLAFGVETDGLDAEGEVVATSDVRPTLAQIDAVLPRFTGAIDQIPPAYSAIKIDGQRAYARARAGEVVDMPTRTVEVFALHLSSPIGGEDAEAYEQSELAQTGEGALTSERTPPSPSAAKAQGPKPCYPLPQGARNGKEVLESITLTAHVSKGTYIRSLARDIALACGTVGHVTMLRRTKAGPFDLSQSISLDKLNQIGQGAPIEGLLLPLEAGLADIPVFRLTPDEVIQVRQGRILNRESLSDGLYWARSVDETPVALMQVEGGHARVERGFNLTHDVAKEDE